MVQLKGKKRWILAPPSQSVALYERYVCYKYGDCVCKYNSHNNCQSEPDFSPHSYIAEASLKFSSASDFDCIERENSFNKSKMLTPETN